jgi:hypothetical protein
MMGGKSRKMKSFIEALSEQKGNGAEDYAT